MIICLSFLVASVRTAALKGCELNSIAMSALCHIELFVTNVGQRERYVEVKQK
jgi:hypothetical protein